MINQLSNLIKKSSQIVFFGGAGVSTESNIPDFRSADGLYANKKKYTYPAEEILSRSFFKNNIEEFYDFYKNEMIYLEARPNKAHYALKDLEEMGKLKYVITQNIDGLHQMAGSKNVLELHGSIRRNYCLACGKFFDLNYIVESKKIPFCDECGFIIKPDVVLYGESLDEETLEKSIKAVREADLLIVGGTSLRVYPAAFLVDYYRGENLVLINKEKTGYDHRASLIFNQSIGKVLSESLEAIM